MAETKFTPGPWGLDSTGSVVTADGGYVAEAYDGLRSTDNDPYIGAANARLIAAAPALYDTERKLCVEVTGTLELYEEGLRQLIGNTNYNVLKLRCDEAKAALLLANTGGTENG